MFIIEMAGLVIQINNLYTYVEKLCKDYICNKKSDFEIEVSTDEIMKEKERLKYSYQADYIECLVIYRKICNKIADYNGFLCHCAVVSIENSAYAFAAKSGTGKSTHIAQWKKLFKDRVTIINGDKPIIRLIGDQLIVYGTPWCGKEGWQTNKCAPLCGFCVLKQGYINRIDPITKNELINHLFNQVMLPDTKERIQKVLQILNHLLERVPCYELSCTISSEAAKVAYNGMRYA